MNLCRQSNVSGFYTLSRLIMAFLPRSKRLSISWLQSPPAAILEPKKIKFDTVSIVSPSICHEMMGPDAMILVFWLLTVVFYTGNGTSALAWRIPWTEEPGGLQSTGSLRVGHDWETSLSLFTFIHWSGLPFPSPMHESEKWKWSLSVVSDS